MENRKWPTEVEDPQDFETKTAAMQAEVANAVAIWFTWWDGGSRAGIKQRSSTTTRRTNMNGNNVVY